MLRCMDEWFAEHWFDAVLGLTSLFLAFAAWRASSTANRIANDAMEAERTRQLRMERIDFTQKVLVFLETRSERVRQDIEWAKRLSSDKQMAKIFLWADSHSSNPVAQQWEIESVNSRLASWILSGDFDYSDNFRGYGFIQTRVQPLHLIFSPPVEEVVSKPRPWWAFLHWGR